jgi:antitoxin ParD1/3/4
MALTPELKQFIQHQVASGKYASVNEVIVAALKLLAAQEANDRLRVGASETGGSQTVGGHRVYRVGPTLVVESEPIADLEVAVNQMREDRIAALLGIDENPI